MALASKPQIWQLVFLALVIVLMLGTFRYQTDLTQASDEGEERLDRKCLLDASVSQQLDLRNPVYYGRLHVDVSESRRHTNASRDFQVPLPQLRRLHSANGTLIAADDDECEITANVEVPKLSRAPVDASGIVFGVATTLDRLEASLSAFAHWAGNTGTTIYCLIDSGSAGRIARVLRDASDLDVHLEISKHNVSDDATDGDRYFDLVKHVYEKSRQKSPQWAAFIDDDTFFPSMPSLL